MKLKLKDLEDAFPGIKGVFDTIGKFSRVIDLSDNYEEAKRVMLLFEEKNKERMPAMNDEGKYLIKEYTLYEQQLNEMREEEIELKKPIKFTMEEVQQALESRKITGSQFVAIRQLFVIKEKPKE